MINKYIEIIKNPEGEPEGYYYNIMEEGSALYGDGPFDTHKDALDAGREYLNHARQTRNL